MAVLKNHLLKAILVWLKASWKQIVWFIIILSALYLENTVKNIVILTKKVFKNKEKTYTVQIYTIIF